MVFVSLKGAGAHSSYLAGPSLWRTPDFESWQVWALGNTQVFSAQRKVPQSLLVIATELSSTEGTNTQTRTDHLGRHSGHVEVWPLMFGFC